MEKDKQSFTENFLELIEKNKFVEVCLFGLTTLNLRHIINVEKDNYLWIKNVLKTELKDSEDPYVQKLKTVYIEVEKYDTLLIKELKNIEISITKKEFGVNEALSYKSGELNEDIKHNKLCELKEDAKLITNEPAKAKWWED